MSNEAIKIALPQPSSPLRAPDRLRLPTKEVVIAATTATGIALSLIFRYGFTDLVPFAPFPLFAVLLVGGLPLIFDLLRNTLRGEFGSDLLAGISIVTSIILGEYLAGSIVVLMLSGGTALEQYASRRASEVLYALAKRMPRIAHRRDGNEIIDIEMDRVSVGDQVVVLPHETCPVDGVIVDGHGSMDESYLTGEPFHISKVPGAMVLSGAINGEAALTIEVEKLPVDSRYAKIMRVMEEAENTRPAFRRIGDRLGAWYTVVALAVAIAGWIIGQDATRFLAVLVIATPCPLLIAIPVAIIGAISQAARRGIIVKNPAMLEVIDSCRTFIFDKTGTLTYGRPALTEIVHSPQITRATALKLAASLEQFSKHPLSQAVLTTARAEKIPLERVMQISEKPGMGLQGIVGIEKVEIIGRKQIPLHSKEVADMIPPIEPGMECILIINGRFGALFRFHDEPREESRAFVEHLGPKHKAGKVMLLSGDRKDEVTYLAAKVGITEILFGKSPEEKLAIVRQEAQIGPTLFVGDGINDAPAMQAATVSVAFGQNSDIAAESADAVVLDASLGKVDEIIHIGRRMRKIALQSAVGGMALSIGGMIIASLGYLPPVAGAVAQELIDVAAVLNALRILVPTKEFREI